MSDVAVLKIEIDEVEPIVTRRIEVPTSVRLDDLHFIFQIAIGWQNCHPFEIRSGGVAWGLIDRDSQENPLPADQATLATVLALGPIFKYAYVYGDDWEHTVTLEKVVAREFSSRYPHLIDAAGRCPPADIGGASGYETYLQALGNAEHELHDDMVDWDDPAFDPNIVDTQTLRANLANLSKYLGRRVA
jgi:hypothetical protein